jgi:multimeric flavodoxin WrbA
LLDRFLEGAKIGGAEIEKLVVTDLDLSGCAGCDACAEAGECVRNDDFAVVNQKLIAADVIALAAPLYFLHLPAQTKALVDRTQSLWRRKATTDEPLASTAAGRDRRRGVFLCVGGSPHPDFHGVVKTTQVFFEMYEAEYWADLRYVSVDEKGAIREHPTAMKDAYDLGRKAATREK